MNMLLRLSPVLLAGLLCGCLEVKDELTLQPDGSGAVRMEVHNRAPEQAMAMNSRVGYGSQSVTYPPVNKAEARHFFPAKDFNLTVNEKDEPGGKLLTIEAAFKNIDALLASPYARAHQLSVQATTNGGFLLRAHGAGETVARMAVAKPEDHGRFQVPGLNEARTNNLRFEFRVTLPNAVTEANGAKDGKTVTWSIERSKCKDDEEFAAKSALVLEARCSADGLKFFPVAPPRLGLLPFPDLAAGATAAAVALPDPAKITSAAQFVPYLLRVTRSLDLSGEGGGRDSQAELVGALVIPAELAPQQWGKVKLEEVVDPKGKSLLPKEDDDSFRYRARSFSRSRFNGFSEEGEEEDDESEAPKTPGPQRHPVSFAFLAPDWKVKEIARIKGAVELQYLGGSHVVKLTNAVPAGLVRDMNQLRSSSSFDSDRGLISNSRLAELGLSLRILMAMSQGPMTTIMLQAGGEKTALVDAQVFDAEGRPWPTTFTRHESSGPERSCQVAVVGRPKPPFSLGLLVSGLGASVSVPVQLEHVPVGGGK